MADFEEVYDFLNSGFCLQINRALVLSNCVDSPMPVDLLALVVAIGALIVSALSYLYARSVKAIDLRLEVSKLRNEVSAKIKRLQATRDKVWEIRSYYFVNERISDSAVAERYRNQYSQDSKEVIGIESDFRYLPSETSSSSHAQLEHRIVQLDQMRVRVDELQIKYDQDKVECEQAIRKMEEKRLLNKDKGA